MSSDTTNTIDSLNEAFIQETAVATSIAAATTIAIAAATTTAATAVAVTSTASVRTYEYCQCYGTFVAAVDEPEIDALVIRAQDFHETTEAIVQSVHCSCPVCVGHLGPCDECDGLYLVKDEVETEEYDEYEEDGLRGSPIEGSPSEDSDIDEPPTTTRLFMDLEESMAQVVLTSKSPR